MIQQMFIDKTFIDHNFLLFDSLTAQLPEKIVNE